MTSVLGIHEAKTGFSQLVKQAAAGHPVLIGSYGKAEVALVAASQLAPNLKRIGVLAGRLQIPEDFDAPLPDDVLKQFET
jgi:prevent-host-death family protein